jgi:hypothetical protein
MKYSGNPIITHALKGNSGKTTHSSRVLGKMLMRARRPNAKRSHAGPIMTGLPQAELPALAVATR